MRDRDIRFVGTSQGRFMRRALGRLLLGVWGVFAGGVSVLAADASSAVEARIAASAPSDVAAAVAAAVSDDALDARAKGRVIGRGAERLEGGFGDSRVPVSMLLYNRNGLISRRELRIRTLEMPAAGDRGLIVFDSPKAQKGTALLTWSHPRASDDQWLYLPALKRVKRIASDNKSGPFVGSEFAYEDLASQEPEEYRWRWLRTEACPVGRCYVVERIPRDENSGYSRQVVTYDARALRKWRVKYFDRRGAPLKTLTADRFHDYQDRWWRASYMNMRNHQTGKRTELLWGEYRFGTGLTQADFKRRALQRVR